jgi:hypothetical protein
MILCGFIFILKTKSKINYVKGRASKLYFETD